MNNTLSNELFLLMVNLCKVRDRARIVQLFTEALSELFEGLEFVFSTGNAPESPNLIEVCTSQHHFGQLIIRGPWDMVPPEKAALIRNAVTMLSLILENHIQAEKLSSEKELLESTVAQRTADLFQANQDLQRVIMEKEKAIYATARLATAIEQSAEAIVITSVDGTIVYVNPAFERITGYSYNESIGSKPSILKSGLHDSSFYSSMWRTITSGAVWKGHIVNRKKDGSLYEEEVTISPVKEDSGTIVNYVAVKRDVTMEVSLHKQLQQAQKMEAIGILAGGVAHDFNNLLQIVAGFSELLLLEKSENTSEYDDLMKIHQAARNGADLVRGLLTFSRRVEPEFVPLNINNNIVQIIKMLERTFPKMIDIRTDLAPDLREINADTTQIEQVLMNLALNARDAMPEGGTLTLETRNVAFDETWCSRHIGFSPGEYVQMIVSDTGNGMSRETTEHIFEPFFTTKHPGSGTGLGLAIVYGIIQQHNGCIRCDSKPGKGTAFEIYFKAIEGIVKPEGAEIDVVSVAKGDGTLLLVDDEEPIRILGNRILREAGYKVLLAKNGREALELFRSEREHISLVILDLSMPAMDGRNCLKELISIDRRVKILIMSGYMDDITAEECINLGAAAFIGKPFRYNELLQQVHSLLTR